MVCCPRPRCRAERSPVHLAHRAYVVVLLTAVMAITGIWSSEPAVADLWRIPAGLLLLGLALEGWLVRRRPGAVRLAIAPRAFLGRPLAVAFVFAHASARPLAVEYAPALPAGLEPPAPVRRGGAARGLRAPGAGAPGERAGARHGAGLRDAVAGAARAAGVAGAAGAPAGCAAARVVELRLAP